MLLGGALQGGGLPFTGGETEAQARERWPGSGRPRAELAPGVPALSDTACVHAAPVPCVGRTRRRCGRGSRQPRASSPGQGHRAGPPAGRSSRLRLGSRPPGPPPSTPWPTASEADEETSLPAGWVQSAPRWLSAWGPAGAPCRAGHLAPVPLSASSGHFLNDASRGRGPGRGQRGVRVLPGAGTGVTAAWAQQLGARGVRALLPQQETGRDCPPLGRGKMRGRARKGPGCRQGGWPGPGSRGVRRGLCSSGRGRQGWLRGAGKRSHRRARPALPTALGSGLCPLAPRRAVTPGTSLPLGEPGAPRAGPCAGPGCGDPL